MASAVDISLLGDKELQRKLDRLVRTEARKITSAAMRKSARRIRGYLLTNIESVLGKRTGQYYGAWRKAKIRKGKSPRALIRLGVAMPDREAFGIDAKAKHFYPAALEYGSKTSPAKPHIRPAVDEHKDAERAAIGRDIGRGIEKAAKRA